MKDNPSYDPRQAQGDLSPDEPVGQPQSPPDTRATSDAYSDWAWEKEGTPVGLMLPNDSARAGFFAGAKWATAHTRSVPQSLSIEETRQRAEDAIRTFCRSLGAAAVQMSHGEERIYYAGISLKALSVAVAMAVSRPLRPQSEPDTSQLGNGK